MGWGGGAFDGGRQGGEIKAGMGGGSLHLHLPAVPIVNHGSTRRLLSVRSGKQGFITKEGATSAKCAYICILCEGVVGGCSSLLWSLAPTCLTISKEASLSLHAAACVVLQDRKRSL